MAARARDRGHAKWLTAGAADDDYWADRAHDQRIEKTTAAVCMVGGWYDIFLPWQLEDYARRKEMSVDVMARWLAPNLAED